MCFHFPLVKWGLSLVKCNTKISLSTSSKVESRDIIESWPQAHHGWACRTVTPSTLLGKVKNVKSSPRLRNASSPDSFGWEQAWTLTRFSHLCRFLHSSGRMQIICNMAEIQKTAILNTSALSCKMTRICHTKLIPRQAAYIWKPQCEFLVLSWDRWLKCSWILAVSDVTVKKDMNPAEQISGFYSCSSLFVTEATVWGTFRDRGRIAS